MLPDRILERSPADHAPGQNELAATLSTAGNREKLLMH